MKARGADAIDSHGGQQGVECLESPPLSVVGERVERALERPGRIKVQLERTRLGQRVVEGVPVGNSAGGVDEGGHVVRLDTFLPRHVPTVRGENERSVVTAGGGRGKLIQVCRGRWLA